MNETTALADFFNNIESAPQFSRRAVNIPGDYRNAWRISVLCLLLQRGRADTLTLPHLHVLWWAVRSSRTRSIFLRWLEGSKGPDEFLVRFDPSLITAVDLAIGEGLVQREPTGNIKLTGAGKLLAGAVGHEASVLVSEKAFLDALPNRITQQQIRDLLEWR